MRFGRVRFQFLVIYSNFRSAALFHLGHYSAASDDILLALNHKYPKNLGSVGFLLERILARVSIQDSHVILNKDKLQNVGVNLSLRF